MNKEMLLKVKAAILAEPSRFAMNEWVVLPHRDAEDEPITQEEFTDCGTVCCIAGHVVP